MVICHSEGHQRGIASNHADVMHWFPQYGKSMDTFRADVARKLKGEMDLTENEVRQIAREEFAKLEAQRAAQPADDWAKPYIQQAVDAGLMAENAAGSIDRPKAPMTRQEMATMGAAILKAARQ